MTPQAHAENEAIEAKQLACKHEGRFKFMSSNIIGSGTCLECGAEVAGDDIFNVYLRKMDAILDAHGIK